MTPEEELIVIPEIVGVSEYVNDPLPNVAAVVPPEPLNGCEDFAMPVVVTMAEPPPTLTPALTRTVITVLALADTESVTVTVSM